jgi:hypothetical protein
MMKSFLMITPLVRDALVRVYHFDQRVNRALNSACKGPDKFTTMPRLGDIRRPFL